MQRRNFLILAAVTALCVVLAVVAVVTGERGPGGAPESRPAFAALGPHLGEVTAVKLQSEETTASFVRWGNSWFDADRGFYPADAGRIRKIVLGLAQLQLVEPKTQEPSLYPRLGVEDPDKGKSHLLGVTGNGGAPLASLIVGEQKYDRLGTGNNGVYVRKPGDKQSWLAAGSLDLAGDPASWLDRRVIDVPQSRIASVALVEADGTKLTVQRKTANDKFALVELPAGAKLKNEDAAGQPAAVLEGLDLEDVAPAAKIPVPASGVTTATLVGFDGLTIDLKLFQKDKKDWLAIAASGTGKAAAEAKKIGDKVANWRYQIPSYKAGSLTIKLADLLAAPKS